MAVPKGKRRRASRKLPIKAVAVLSAGASTSPLMAGALAAIYEAGRTFHWMFTSGSGSLVGLSFAAPRMKSPPDALKNLLEMTISDPIFDVAPFAYKAFYKSGPWSEINRKLTPFFQFPSPETSMGRLYNDAVAFALQAVAPSDLNYFSQGLCNPNPWIEDLVDFDKLRKFKGDLTVNAYNITRGHMVHFNKTKLTADHLRAATSCPFFYAPYQLDGDYYFEGADIDPINLPKLLDLATRRKVVSKRIQDQYKKSVEPAHRATFNFDAKEDRLELDRHAGNLAIVMFDVLGALPDSAVLRVPRNIFDAYSISLITPLRSIINTRVELFQKVFADPFKLDFVKVRFDIPKKYWPTLTDWTRTNGERLWDIGYETGKKYIKNELAGLLPEHEDGNANPK